MVHIIFLSILSVVPCVVKAKLQIRLFFKLKSTDILISPRKYVVGTH